MIPRWYQSEAEDSIYRYFGTNDGNPLIVLPTGSGKSFVQASFVRGVIERFPRQRFMLVTHVKELLEQNGKELVATWPEAAFKLGYYSASLKNRDTDSSIIVAGIQSCYAKAHEFGHIDLVIIDECHLVPPKNMGMYRTFLDEMRQLNPKVKVIGMTATPYRLGTGMLHHGDGAIFTDIAYSADIKRLIADGYLAPLTTKLGKDRADLSTVKKRGGEYIPGQLDKVMSDEDVVKAAVDETIELASDRKKWLVFCSGIGHAECVEAELERRGIRCATVTGKTPKAERDEIIGRFKRGELRALTNVNVLTTGFNVPDIDLLVVLRPTMSTSLHVQMMGRGMRVAPGKTDCLVLDFTDNILTHGPIDKIEIREKDGIDEIGTAPMRLCPSCEELVLISATECPECGHVFERDERPRHQAKPNIGAEVMSSFVKPEWHEVTDVKYRRHQKAGKPDSLRVDYQLGLRRVSEWVCLEHEGFASRKAETWWRIRSDHPVPESTDDALARISELREPARLMLDTNGKFERVLRCELKEEGDPCLMQSKPLLFG